ncbi:putative gustatory receptor clone PTE03, partial [Oncorhynchus masou masou]|uniref:putative gustatory receptor clone PTE03 n=1 Tax=Oncorhynchus masou masou TaxID=90313 RepID=UPI0031845E30
MQTGSSGCFMQTGSSGCSMQAGSTGCAKQVGDSGNAVEAEGPGSTKQAGDSSSAGEEEEGFNIPPESAFSAFIFAILSYMVILFCNLVLILTIILNRSLHQPMYLLLLNLPINDLIGSTALFTQLIKELLLDTRTIQYSACVTQAFFIHVYGTGSVFILTAMAYDRYIAICSPLRYNTLMTNAHLRKIITLLWVCDLMLIGVLFFLLLRLPRCRSLMSHPYCDNPSLLKLVCANTAINNIYGLFITALMQVIVVSTILYTYVQILVTCFRNKGSADTKSKALQTCATHLIVFILLEFSSRMVL